MVESRLLTFVYTFILGLMLAFFVGFGINTFYESPKAPEYPVGIESYGKEPTEEQLAKDRAFEVQMREYQDQQEPYSRNVSLIALLAAVFLVALSILSDKRVKVLADGVMLGGLFTLIYSIIRAVSSADSKYIFVVVSVGLAVVLFLGYYRFVHGDASARLIKKTSKK